MQAIAEEYLARLQEARCTTRWRATGDNFLFGHRTRCRPAPARRRILVSDLVGCVRFSGTLEKLSSMPSVGEIYGVEVILEVGPCPRDSRKHIRR